MTCWVGVCRACIFDVMRYTLSTVDSRRRVYVREEKWKLGKTEQWRRALLQCYCAAELAFTAVLLLACVAAAAAVRAELSVSVLMKRRRFFSYSGSRNLRCKRSVAGFNLLLLYYCFLVDFSVRATEPRLRRLVNRTELGECWLTDCFTAVLVVSLFAGCGWEHSAVLSESVWEALLVLLQGGTGRVFSQRQLPGWSCQ